MRHETFRWDFRIYDVTAILRDIASGALKPTPLEWPAAAVKAYFDLYLNSSSPTPRPPLSVDIKYALSLPQSRLDEAIIMVHVENQGLIAYEEQDDEPRHVIADGNHRVAFAAARGVGLRALVLSRSQSEPYETIIE